MNKPPILIDNSVLADFFVGVDSLMTNAANLRRQFPHWMTPQLCRYEFGNVLRTYLRREMIGEAEAQLMLRKGLAMVSFCEECPVEVILAEAQASGLSFYDTTYVSCACKLGYSLYTRDDVILKNCAEIACSPTAF